MHQDRRKFQRKLSANFLPAGKKGPIFRCGEKTGIMKSIRNYIYNEKCQLAEARWLYKRIIPLIDTGDIDGGSATDWKKPNECTSHT